jgi:uncharacterized protein (DUF58 family)
MSGALRTGVLGVVLVLVAATFDAEPLYVPGVAFTALAAVAAIWVTVGARGLRLDRTVSARSVLEDEKVSIEIVARAGWLTLPPGFVDDPLLPAPARLAAGRRTSTVRINVSFARRGAKTLQAPRVVVADPFGLARVQISEGTDAELLVLPALYPVRAAASSGADGVLGVRAGRPQVAAEVEIDGLRPHRPGTAASRISWAALARTGELMERRLRADTDTRPLIVLDPRCDAGEEALAGLDAAVRAVASLSSHLARSGGCALLLPGDRRPVVLESLHGWDRLHVRLALLGPGPAPALTTHSGRRGAVIYVAARPLARAPRALAHATAGTRVLVVPGALTGRAAAFTVAGCSGYALDAAGGRLAAA